MSLLDHDDDTWRVWAPAALQRLAVAGLPRSTPTGRSPTWPRPAAGKPNTPAMSGRCAASGSTATALCGSPGSRSHGCGNRPNGGCGWRLSTGLGLEAGGGRPVVAITRFARFLTADRRSIGSTRSTGRCWNATWPTCSSDSPAPSAAAPTSDCSTGSSPRSANTVGTQHFPPTRCSSPRTIPQRERTAAARVGRAGHGPARAPRQPRPVRQPRLPADHR